MLQQYIYTRIYYIWLDIYIVNSTYITYISYMTRTHSPTFFNTPPHIFSQAMLRGHTKSASSKNPTCSARRIQNLLCVEDGHHNPQGRSWCRLFHGFFHWKCAKKKTSQLLSFGQKCNNQQASKRCPNDNGIEPQLAKKIFPRFGFAKWICFEVL